LFCQKVVNGFRILTDDSAEVRVFLTLIIGAIDLLNVTLITLVTLLATLPFLLVSKVNTSFANSLTANSIIFYVLSQQLEEEITGFAQYRDVGQVYVRYSAAYQIKHKLKFITTLNVSK
jgi:hypothetical protein